jgi:sugar lactone lactonase YvrE
MKLFFRSPWPAGVAVAALWSVVFILSSSGHALAADQATSTETAIYLAQVKRELPLLNDAVQSIEPRANGGAVFQAPVDAALDPDAKNIFFVANSAQGMGVFKTSINGGAVVSLTVSTPFSTPLGLDVSTDGQTIFVADTSARLQSQFRRFPLGTFEGMLFRVPASGGAPVAVAGSECTSPRGLTLVNENGADVIYFTGVDPHDDKPAIMKIPAAGGTLTVITKGDPLVRPTGIAVGKDGHIYVTDQGSATNGLGNVFRFHNTTIAAAGVIPSEPHPSHSENLATVRGGNPAGVTLTQDGSLLLVSSLDGTQGTSQVLVINTTTLQQGIVNTVIGANTSSGGLHRAYNGTEMVWVDSTGGGDGRIYIVKLKP